MQFIVNVAAIAHETQSFMMVLVVHLEPQTFSPYVRHVMKKSNLVTWIWMTSNVVRASTLLQLQQCIA